MLIILFASLIAITLAQNNSVLPGAGFKQISAKGNELWAITEHNQVVRYNGNGWEFKNRGFAISIAAASNGHAWLINTNVDWENVVRWNPDNNNWDYVPGWAFVLNGDFGLHVGRDAQLYRLDGNGNFFAVNSADYNNYQGAIGVDEDTWRIDQNYNLYHLVSDAWQQVSTDAIGTPVHIDVNDASKVVVTNQNQTAFLYDGQNFNVLSSNCTQATVGSASAYCLNLAGQVVQFDLGGGGGVTPPPPPPPPYPTRD